MEKKLGSIRHKMFLETGLENKNKLLSLRISNFIQLFYSLMSHFSQTFLLKRRHLKNLKKSANKFMKFKKFNIILKEK